MSYGDGSSAAQSPRWWPEDADHCRVVDILEQIRDRQTERDAQLRDAFCLFDDFPALGFSPSRYQVRRTGSRAQQGYNLVRACCTTAQSEIIQAQPRAMFVTTDGEWSIRRKAKKLSQFVEGVFEENDFDALAAAACTDALVAGAGLARGYVQDGRVCFERVLPDEFWVDERDGYYGRPRSFYLCRHVDRDELKELYPDFAAAIAAVPTADDAWQWQGDVADQVLVVEAWHLPATKKSKDGRHVIAIKGTALESEEWPHDWIPVLHLRWRDPLRGFWGQGLATELGGIQTSINKKLKAIDRGEHFFSNPWIGLERGSQINKNQLSNVEATCVDFSKTPPIPILFPTVSPEIRQGLLDDIRRGYEVAGINAIGARSETPAGVTSGKAIRTYANLQSRRLIDFQRAYERFHVDAARLAVRLMEQAANDDEALEVVYSAHGRAERIDWNDVRLDESQYVLSTAAVSALPSTPSGRLAWVQEMVSSGFAAQVGLGPVETLRLLNFPDVEQAAKRITSSLDLIEQLLERLADTFDYDACQPEEFFDLDLCVLVGSRTYQQWTLDEAPDELMDLLGQWIDRARQLRDAAKAALAPPLPAGPPGADPNAPPGAPVAPQGLPMAA